MSLIRMINWSNLPIESIDGLNGNEVNFLSDLSMGGRDEANDEKLMEFIRFIECGDDDALPPLPSEEEACPEDPMRNKPCNSADVSVTSKDISSADVSAMDTAVLQALPRTSREQMYEHGGRFVGFVRNKSSTADLVTMESTMLNEYLRFFYFTLETKQGAKYSPASLVCIRAGIQRYFEFVVKRKVDLKSDDCFKSSNRMLEMKAKEFVEAGGDVKHYNPIEPRDMEKMKCYFSGTGGNYSSDERLQDDCGTIGPRFIMPT